MRLTKRQLKRIIREEYSRLKRRGLINENLGGNPIEALCDDMMHAMPGTNICTKLEQKVLK